MVSTKTLLSNTFKPPLLTKMFEKKKMFDLLLLKENKMKENKMFDLLILKKTKMFDLLLLAWSDDGGLRRGGGQHNLFLLPLLLL